MLKFSRLLDKINAKIGQLSAWLVLLLILVVVEQVVSRYVFKNSSIAIQELMWHLFGVIFLLSTAWTYERSGHVRVDLIYAKLKPKFKAWINCFGILLFLMPLSMMLIYHGYDFVVSALDFNNPRPADYYTQALDKNGFLYGLLSPIESTFRSVVLQGEISSDPGGLEGRWIIKAMIPLGYALLFLQGLSHFIKNGAVLLGKEEQI